MKNVFFVTAFILFLLFILNRLKIGRGFSFNLSDFSDELGKMESGNNYKIKNSIGALGKYQFMPTTLNDLRDRFKLPEWKPESNFLDSPDLQEQYFKNHVKNILTLVDEKEFNEFYGTLVTGRLRFTDLVTGANIYGIVAGSHLAGVGGCKKFVKGISDPDDGHTAVSDYVTYFSDSLKSKL